MSNEESIVAEGLCKTYVRHERGSGLLGLTGRKRVHIQALSDVSFRVAEGEMVGLIGPNGAGKSTTVKLLTGILTPTSGSCMVGGLVPWERRKQHVRRIGTVFGQRMQLWWDVPIQDSFDLLRDIYAIDETRYQHRLRELVDALDLSELLTTPLRQMSLGQRMRAELCGSLLHEPRWLFLDEPTIGLDAVNKLRLRAFLREENSRRGTTILLTTHDMEDMTALCERALVLGHGQLLYDGALKELLSRYDREQTLRCRFDGEVRMPPLPDDIRHQRDGEDHLFVFQPSQHTMQDVMSLILSCGQVREMELQQRNVNEIIAQIYAEMKL